MPTMKEKIDAGRRAEALKNGGSVIDLSRLSPSQAAALIPGYRQPSIALLGIEPNAADRIAAGAAKRARRNSTTR